MEEDLDCQNLQKITAHVFFGAVLSSHDRRMLAAASVDTVVIVPRVLYESCSDFVGTVLVLEDFIDAGSIYEAYALLEELSVLSLHDGTRIPKICTFKGYELWWINYNTLYIASCIPYTQYGRLLTHLARFKKVHLHNPPHEGLFSAYLEGYAVAYEVHRTLRAWVSTVLPFGIVLQGVVSLASVFVRMVIRKPALVFTGDKFEKLRDHDPRMRDLYEALRSERVPFVEVVRSLESWKTVLAHIFVRKRPVVYSLPFLFFGRMLSTLTGAKSSSEQRIRRSISDTTKNSEKRFKLLLATLYVRDAAADVWAIRMATVAVRLMGIRSAFFTKVSDRNFHFFIACKLCGITTVGILHGVASRYYNVYDFLSTYDGEKKLSLDAYGVWSEWWKEYYIQHSRAYTAPQLFVAGPMRPLLRDVGIPQQQTRELSKKIKVLFVSEQLAVPQEVLPFLEALLRTSEFEVYIKFRPYRDGFELWLTEQCPKVLRTVGEDKILRGTMQEAIAGVDVVVGSHSTAVLEALLVEKPIVFFKTKKWGDYFELKKYDSPFVFYAEDDAVFVKAVFDSHTITAAVLQDLVKRFFGDPYQNGSLWAVKKLRDALM